MRDRLFGFMLMVCMSCTIAVGVCTAQPVPEGMEKVQVTIKGMTCSACSDKVQTALDALPDVRSIVVRWSEGSAELLVNKGSNHKELKEAIERASFMVSSIECGCKG